MPNIQYQMSTVVSEWLFGWDDTPGIVSVWADADGRATVWRRVDGAVVREDTRFQPWALVSDIDGLTAADVSWRELDGPGELRFHVSAASGRALSSALLAAAATRGVQAAHVSELDKGDVCMLPPEEQYLVATGRTYFKGLAFDDLRRLQFDLETTGLDAARDRILLIAVRHPDGRVEFIEDDVEGAMIRRLAETIRAADPDVIENHNLHEIGRAHV